MLSLSALDFLHQPQLNVNFIGESSHHSSSVQLVKALMMASVRTTLCGHFWPHAVSICHSSVQVTQKARDLPRYSSIIISPLELSLINVVFPQRYCGKYNGWHLSLGIKCQISSANEVPISHSHTIQYHLYGRQCGTIQLFHNTLNFLDENLSSSRSDWEYNRIRNSTPLSCFVNVIKPHWLFLQNSHIFI